MALTPAVRKNKKISVIIPAYNEEQYIARALDGLAQQSIPRADFEIIVVDNASTDHTATCAAAHGADLVVREEKRGTNQARQRGLLESRGKIVAFLDADCIPPPDWLLTIRTILNSRKHPCVAVAGAYAFYDNDDEAFYVMQEIYRWVVMPALGSLMGRMLKKGGVVIGGNFATFRKYFMKLGGIDTSYAFFGDDASIARRFGELGYVHYEPKLYVMSSYRRFSREGLVKTNWEYTKNYLKVMFEDAIPFKK
ncbi:glycosyltransferase family 2 protein [Candidatus Uhrbacteria bacterium]|nr:glycosyltransferase family 2 protein [Candidatus Uhrbacteria bacterium]